MNRDDEIKRLEREYTTLQSELLHATSPKFTGKFCDSQSVEDKPVVHPAQYDGSVSWEDYEIQFELIT